MREYRWLKRGGVIVALALMVLFATMVTGCGKSADTLYKEGKTLIGKPETQAKGLEMLAKFEKRFPKDPRTPEVIFGVASFYQSEKKFSEAEAGFNRLIEMYPNTAEAYKGMFLLGYMYYEDIKDTEKAKTVLNKFIAAYPDSGMMTESAKMLVANIGLPVEEWSTVKNIMAQQEPAPASAQSTPAAK
ncbi:MAG: tetratricopeptide repeat protein [Candidatus Latescibacterota bacterium]